jgi:sodium-dependent dicarboxylate transporter 2/3/5
VGLAAGPALAVAVYLLLGASKLEPAGRATAAVALLMAVWWVTEALPIAATSLVPIVLFPLCGVRTIEETTAPYARPVIFLFMGGFMAGLAMQRWNLHRRFALAVLRLFGTDPRWIVAGFMLASGVLSMGVSNTATVVMMVPIGLSLIDLVDRHRPEHVDERDTRRFALCLLLGIAYGASIGGVGTLIGTPPNTLLAGYVKENYGQTISFASWLPLGVPFAIIFWPLAWLVLTRFAFPVRFDRVPGGRELIDRELREIGAIKPAEISVLVVWATMALLWVTRRPLEAWSGLALDDSTIAIFGALALFIIPAAGEAPGERLLNWRWAAKLPWGVLVLFGGGLSLAAAVKANGVAEFIGTSLAGLQALGTFGLIVLVVTVVIFLTELTSNTATTAAFLPVLGALAASMKVHPYLLLLPATMAASCAFMLPVATPPNAIVFSSGQVRIPQMAKAGLWLNLIGIVLVSLYVMFAAGPLLGIDLSTFPDWAQPGGP